MKRKAFFIGLSFCILLAANGVHAAAVKFIAGHTGPPGNSVYIFFDEFAKRVASQTEGRYILEVHPGGELGGDKQLIESLRLGTIDIASAASNNMPPFTNAFLWGDLPYIFRSREGAHKVWQGPIGKEVAAHCLKDVGTVVTAYVDVGGFRLLVNNKKAIRSPAGTKGIKFRVTQSPIAAAVIREWGGNPTPIGWAETFTSVQQKVVDGLHLHPLWLYLNGFGKIVKYATEVMALSNVHVVQFNKEKWNSLSKEDKAIFTKCAAEARDIANASDTDGEEKFKEKLQEQGVEIYTPTDEEMQKWKDIKEKVWDAFSKKVGGKDFISGIVEAQK